MATFKCKMCGGNLDVFERQTVVECEYCGSKQTVPTVKDENLQALYNRANVLRMKNEFDRAGEIYEKILLSDNTQAEAHWGVILCKFGIEYVEDPKTFKCMPTCHRTSFDTVVSDEDYKLAIEYADPFQRELYKAEAEEIDRLQKSIIEISSKEEPYDIFICYKQTDETGKRTEDSVISNDIYYQLTNAGYKVFYAAITLEDKIGKEYEPCIFSALNSSKVMLVIGTKPEYFNAVWVKNEWSRYLSLIKKDRSKMLIPCYKGMDAYELPDEFSHFQAQDMGKIGFINDIVRGIKKVTGNNTVPDKGAAVDRIEASIASLIKRVFMFLEDGDFKSADEYCEKVLDIDPENAEAYLGKLMAEQKVSKRQQLADCETDYDKNALYAKVVKFGTAELKAELESYKPTAKQKYIYKHARDVMNAAKSEEDWMTAAKSFEEIMGYKDSKNLINVCRKKAAEAKKQIELRMQHAYRAARMTIAAGDDCIVCLKDSGTVFAYGNNRNGQCDVSDWKNIIAVAAGDSHTVGLKSDGTVVAVGRNSIGQCSNISKWKDIVAVSAGYFSTAGLKSDGTVEWNYSKYNGETKSWKDIVAISVGHLSGNISDDFLVGLKRNGTVVIVGVDEEIAREVELWENIVEISASKTRHRVIVGLKSDGTVIAVGDSDYGKCDVSDWTDIVAVSSGSYHTVGLKANGRVVAVGDSGDGRCNVNHITSVVAIACGDHFTLTLSNSGSVAVEGFLDYNYYSSNPLDTYTKNGREASRLRKYAKIPLSARGTTWEELKNDEKRQLELKRQEEERQAELQRQEEEKKANYRAQGVCQHCGGSFKGLFSKKCSVCGKPKDY